MQIARIGDGAAEQYSAELVGGKAANLARVAALGLPVPPAFVLPIDLCAASLSGDASSMQSLSDGLTEGIEFLENATGKRFADRRRPLLVSVRSGAARSMPGMLDTVLNVGCTSTAVRGLVRMTGHPRFAGDCRRRFLESYGGVVLGVDPAAFVAKRNELVAAEGVGSERALDCEALERLATAYEQVIERDRPCAQRRPHGTAQDRGAGGVSFVAERPRLHLSQARASRIFAGHGGHGAGHGVRQCRNFLGRRRGVFTRSVDRAE